MVVKHEEEPGPVNLPIGKQVAGRWKIVEKLGEGGCGAVYLVLDKKTGSNGALKAESNFAEGGAVLKLEVKVLKRLQGKKYMAQLIASGKKERYSYMVMSLFGPSLSTLFKKCGREFSISTVVRVGIQILYGLKTLHEIGYVHRDVKPANLAIGMKGPDIRMVHMLDFGLAREFVIRTDNKIEIRRPRDAALFRGTYKYCSYNSHNRSEQGRPDDLWSMVYVLSEFRSPLPWSQQNDKKEIARMKGEVPDEKLFQRAPSELLAITTHIRSLDYYKRPDYKLIFDIFCQTMNKYKIRYSDPFDWELYGIGTSPGKSKLRRRLSRILSITEDQSVDLKTMENVAAEPHTAEEPQNQDQMPFTADYFEKNELGF
ncbi:hypothetical protein M3Y94_00899100 [Aphelenchoides besseyi]|nr:hypothetical protein M3Y94_00899100 [Aphelenchoides besseyi]KAI6223368.1 putative serine/threonine-protein kinase K06H7.1 [Aphelenchoides besseyi]